MPTENLPERASLEYLKELAKERLLALRTTEPAAKLSGAQLAIAREHGFQSWRALKAGIDRRRAPKIAAFVRACTDGDTGTLRELLKDDVGLARERLASGSTGLHLAVRHPDVLRLLIEHGAERRWRWRCCAVIGKPCGCSKLPAHGNLKDRTKQDVRTIWRRSQAR